MSLDDLKADLRVLISSWEGKQGQFTRLMGSALITLVVSVLIPVVGQEHTALSSAVGPPVLLLVFVVPDFLALRRPLGNEVKDRKNHLFQISFGGSLVIGFVLVGIIALWKKEQWLGCLKGMIWVVSVWLILMFIQYGQFKREYYNQLRELTWRVLGEVEVLCDSNKPQLIRRIRAEDRVSWLYSNEVYNSTSPETGILPTWQAWITFVLGSAPHLPKEPKIELVD